jgi:sec-independent protein translocase protein TatC
MRYQMRQRGPRGSRQVEAVAQQLCPGALHFPWPLHDHLASLRGQVALSWVEVCILLYTQMPRGFIGRGKSMRANVKFILPLYLRPSNRNEPVGLLSSLNQLRGKKKRKGPADEEEAEMSFLDHLEELRWHIFRAFIAIAVVGVFIFVKISWVLDEIILWPSRANFPINQALCDLRASLCFEQTNVQLIAISPYEQFLKSISVAFVGGFVVAFPVVLWEIWRFIKPGLHPKERNGLRGNVFVMSILFFLGVAFAYFVITPFSFRFLSTYQLSAAVSNQWQIGKVIGLITQISIGGGLIFEMPILIYYLAKVGLVTDKSMKTYRRHAIVVLLTLSAIITPPDVTSQILIFVPLWLLYEMSIGIARRVSRKREKELAEM